MGEEEERGMGEEEERGMGEEEERTEWGKSTKIEFLLGCTSVPSSVWVTFPPATLIVTVTRSPIMTRGS